MNKAHNVQSISFTGEIMRLRVDGRDYDIDIGKKLNRLARATPEQRANFEISPSGYGIHWPDVDEDLSIDGLIGVKHSRSASRNIASPGYRPLSSMENILPTAPWRRATRPL